MNMKLHGDKIAYFFIAFAVYLLIRAFSAHLTLPIVNVLLYVSIAASLLASNVPRVMDIPLQPSACPWSALSPCVCAICGFDLNFRPKLYIITVKIKQGSLYQQAERK